jgi:serine protease Do
MGIGFAIPMSMAKTVMEDIVTKGKVIRGWIGVSVQNITASMRTVLNLGSRKGVLVSDVFKSQPADKAGIRRGDVILSISGNDVANANELSLAVSTLKPGSKVPAVIFRSGREMTLQITVEQRSEAAVSKLGSKTPEQPVPPKEANKSEKRFGLTLFDLTPELRNRYGIPGNLTGLVITSVDQSLTDARASLQEGDVIEQVKVKDRDYQPVVSIGQFDAVTKNVKKGDSVLLVVVHKSVSLFIGFTVQ